MKFRLIALSLLLSSTAVFAERTALINHDDEWNLFTKFEASSTDIDGNGAVFGGLTVGGLLNDHFGIGVAGHVLVDSVETPSSGLAEIQSGDIFYGGGYLEYVFTPDNLVYVSLDVLVGGGRLEVKSPAGADLTETVFIVEPGLNLMINITETFHFGLGASYRFADDITIAGMDKGALEDWSGNAFFRFTQF